MWSVFSGINIFWWLCSHWICRKNIFIQIKIGFELIYLFIESTYQLSRHIMNFEYKSETWWIVVQFDTLSDITFYRKNFWNLSHFLSVQSYLSIMWHYGKYHLLSGLIIWSVFLCIWKYFIYSIYSITPFRYSASPC